MMKNWIKCTLGDIVIFQRGFDLPKSEMKEGKFPVVGSNGIIGYHDEYTTKPPGLSVGRSGNVGNPFIINIPSWSHNTTLFVKSFKNSYPLFVYYFLKTLDLSKYSGGSAVPTLNRNHIHSIPIKVPEIEEQKKIAEILGSLDKKIKLNKKINKNLIYKITNKLKDIFKFRHLKHQFLQTLV